MKSRFFLLFLLAISPLRGEFHQKYQKWEKSFVKEMATIPLQDGGRIKPLSTYSRYVLLRFSGKSSVHFPLGDKNQKISSLEFLLDCFFRPQLAQKYEIFQVPDTGILHSFGLPVDKKKRKRYSYLFFADKREKIEELTHQYASLDEKKLSRIQKQILNLGMNLRLFDILSANFDFVRLPILIKTEKDGIVKIPLSVLLKASPVLRQWAFQMQESNAKPPDEILSMLNNVGFLIERSRYGSLFLPPVNTEKKLWQNFGQRSLALLEGKYLPEENLLRPFLHLEDAFIALQEEKMSDFYQHLLSWKQEIISQSQNLEGIGKLKWENWYYSFKLLSLSLSFFLFSLILAFFHHFLAIEKLHCYFAKGIRYLFISGTVILWISILYRSFLMGRPPVGNLYDTIPFITAISLIFCLLLNRKEVKNELFLLGAVLGLLGLLLAFRYEFSQGIDVFDPLVAVLNSNFWLTIHVLTITAGYGAGLFTSALSKVYLLNKVFKKTQKNQQILQIIYIGVFLTLAFSLLGTILGGIWANESWGRFWGWDPKENGALMIVLWNLIILHSRLAGLIKHWGLAIASSFGGIIVVFSWWHVNFLGVGLHSYGFSEGKSAIWYYYFFELCFCIFFLGFAWLKKEQLKRN